MIKLKFGTVRRGEIFDSLGHIAQLPLDQKWAYRVAKIMRKLNEEVKTIQDLFQKLVKQYAVLDENGEIKPITEDGQVKPGTYEIDPAKMEEWRKKLTEFDNETCTLDVEKLPLAALEKSRIPAVVYVGLDALLSEGELKLVDNETTEPTKATQAE
jgi:hypothetical protein